MEAAERQGGISEPTLVEQVTPHDQRSVYDLVVDQLAQIPDGAQVATDLRQRRRRLGVEQYDVSPHAPNQLINRQDAYDESLDLISYLMHCAEGGNYQAAHLLPSALNIARHLCLELSQVT